MALLLLPMGVSEGWAQSGREEMESEVRVVMHDDGTRTEYVKNGYERTLVATTYQNLEDDVVVLRRAFELDARGNELRCRIFDAGGNQISTLLYEYNRESGRLMAQGTFDEKGYLQRVVMYPHVDGQRLKPVVTKVRVNGILWVHAADGSGMVPARGEEVVVSSDVVQTVEYTQEQIEAATMEAQPTDLELHRQARNTGLTPGEKRSLDDFINNYEMERADLSPEAEQHVQRWRNEQADGARQRR